MEIIPLAINGAFLIKYRKLGDDRGSFVKTFNKDLMSSCEGLVMFSLAEEFYSTSTKGVLRGMHFQTPPFDHNKFLYCIDGNVLDVFVDIRTESSTFGRHEKLELNSCEPSAIYLPKGIAHGFYTLSDSATLVYKTDCKYSQEHDKGIRWDSCGIDWNAETPIVSYRDKNLPSLVEFRSPFK